MPIEGTTRTWGQDIVATQQHTNAQAALTTQAISEGDKSGTPSTATTMGPAQSADAKQVLPSGDPPAVMTGANVAVLAGSVAPQDTLVSVIANTVDKIAEGSSLGCKEKATIAMAAASTNKAATVAVASELLVVDQPQTLFGSALNSVATVLPNVTETFIVLGSTLKEKEEIKKALTEAQKVDLSFTLRSKQSESIEFNNLKRPTLEVGFSYNFFVEDEEDIEEQEDPTKDPLLNHRAVDTPRISDIRWPVISVTEPLAGTEVEVKKNEALRQETFGKPKGQFSVSTFSLPHSINKSQKDQELYFQDGLSRQVTDIHSPEIVFDAIANDAVFANKVGATLNISVQGSVINEIPFLAIK